MPAAVVPGRGRVALIPPRAVLRWLPVALWAVGILALATDLGSGERTGALLEPLLGALGLSEASLAVAHAVVRALGHVVGYAVFALLLLRARRGTARPATQALLGSLVLAALDETIQGLVPGRTGDPLDLLLDVGGAAAALALFARRRAAAGLRGSGAPSP